uniref:Uncharacterized protein n=1 Tax=Arundo donax TaxID=35708 RepID=A0A0A9HHJ1_ARUDO
MSQQQCDEKPVVRINIVLLPGSKHCES